MAWPQPGPTAGARQRFYLWDPRLGGYQHISSAEAPETFRAPGRAQRGKFQSFQDIQEDALTPPTDLVTGVNVHSIAQVIQSLVQVPRACRPQKAGSSIGLWGGGKRQVVSVPVPQGSHRPCAHNIPSGDLSTRRSGCSAALYLGFPSLWVLIHMIIPARTEERLRVIPNRFQCRTLHTAGFGCLQATEPSVSHTPPPPSPVRYWGIILAKHTLY